MLTGTINPAFELLRNHKQVSSETERLVLKKVSGRIKTPELLQCFENGISGQYGKVYALDPQTLISWVEAFLRAKNASGSYLESPMLPKGVKVTSLAYPQKSEDWNKEVNKAYTAFLNGVPYTDIHPDIYGHLILDGRIPMGSLKKYTPENYPECAEHEIEHAQQRVIADYFNKCKANGWAEIYRKTW